MVSCAERCETAHFAGEATKMSNVSLILRVDLSTGTISREPISEELRRRYLGGDGFGAGSKTQFTYKSPAYNIFGGTSCGGGIGSQLRWAGYEHVVITGK